MVMGGLRPVWQILLGLFLVLVLGAATALRALSVGVSMYFLVVVGACFVFRQRGWWVLIPMLLTYHWSGRGTLTLPQALLQDTLALVEWVFLALVVNVSLNKYYELKQYDNRVRTDMNLAMTLQRSLMPKAFESRKVSVHSVIQQTFDIGGDFYFFRPFEKKYVIFCLGDIMGKGISASLVMAMVLGFFYEWGKQSHSPAFIMRTLNERLISVWGDDAPSFATMFYSIYDEETRELVYCCAGNHGALRVSQDGVVTTLNAEGIPLGVFENFDWEEKRVTLDQGDRVVAFTDGVNESRNAGGDLFTMDRVQEFLLEHRQESSKDMVNHLLERVMTFAVGTQIADDVAILCMEVRG
jgi:sigma-B regulation protein RsbU (phosphoserine phosphatase)